MVRQRPPLQIPAALAGDETLRRRLGASAGRVVAEEFAQETVVGCTLLIYDYMFK